MKRLHPSRLARGPMEDPEGPPKAGSWIEIDKRALQENIRELQRWVGETTLCMVVKGNAYGHGYEPIVPIAEEAGVRHFAVFSAREAWGFLNASQADSRLMVMGHSDHRNLPWLLDNGIEPWINDSMDWPLLRDKAAQMERDARVHLEIETGMNRSGVPMDDAFDMAVAIHDDDNVHLEGICTHLAGAESQANEDRIGVQKERYFTLLDRLDEVGVRPHSRHIASSASALRDPGSRLDLVRMGIAVYGLWPTAEVYKEVSALPDAPILRNVLGWKSRIVACKGARDGEFIGYGRSYQAEGDLRYAVVAVGYGDGFARELSNRGHVLIQGRRASIIGHVNMNMIQVHTTHLPDAKIGEEVVLIGRQRDNEISVASFADFNSVVNYELMARLSWEIPRIVVEPDELVEPLE